MYMPLICPPARPVPKGEGDIRPRTLNEDPESGGRDNPRHRDLPPSGTPPGLV